MLSSLAVTREGGVFEVAVQLAFLAIRRLRCLSRSVSIVARVVVVSVVVCRLV